VSGDDGAEIHSALSKLSILGVLSTDELAVQAVALFKRCPPEQLMRSGHFQLQWCARATPSCCARSFIS